MTSTPRLPLGSLKDTVCMLTATSTKSPDLMSTGFSRRILPEAS